MKFYPLPKIVPLVVLFAALSAQAQDNLSEGLQKGLLQEEAHQDLNAAIAAYEGVLQRFDAQRKLAATAAFRLGECYRKQGKRSEAAAQFERVAREFSDQTSLAQLSRKYLAEAAQSGSAPGGAAPATPTLARTNPEEVRLLREEISLVEQLLADAEKRRENGRASSADLVEIQRQLLPLRRKLPENADVSKQQELIKEEIALVQNLLSQQQKQVEVGVISKTDQIPLRRDLLSLQRELLTVQNRPAFQTRLNQIVRAESPDAPAEEEAKEIQRLERIIQNSPDLINGRANGQTPLHLAASKGQVNVARFLLQNHADVNAATLPPSHGAMTPLHLAADAGHKAMTELLLNSGADVNAANAQGETPLFQAASRGYAALASVLIAAGAEVNATTQNLLTPLHYALSTGQRAMCELLLAKKADVNAQPGQGNTPLIHAVQFKKLELVKFLLEHGADVQRKSKDGITALTWSVQQGTPQITEVLLEHGANPNVTGIKIESRITNTTGAPLHWAAFRDDVRLLRSLLQHGANIDLQDPAGQTPLHLAVAHSSQAAAQELLQRSANPDIADLQGRTVLLLVLAADQADLLPQVLEKSHQVNLLSQEGVSPLLLAIKLNKKNTAELLLQQGADPNQKGLDGYSPLHVAVGGKGNLELVQLLLTHHAEVNTRDGAGNTPLHYATLRGAKQIVKLLLASGADPRLTNAAGETPLVLLTGSKESGPKQYGWNDWGLPIPMGGDVSGLGLGPRSADQRETVTLLEQTAPSKRETPEVRETK